MKKRKWLKLLLAVSYAMLVCTSVAFAGPVPDTGVSSEPACNPHSYTDLGNGIIKDNVTGLMWQKDIAPGNYTLDEAGVYCKNLTLGGYTDWYVPTVRELTSLVDSSIPQPGPTINAAYFPNTVASGYWSSTTNASNTSDAWLVGFDFGVVRSHSKSTHYCVRAVRSGQ